MKKFWPLLWLIPFATLSVHASLAIPPMCDASHSLTTFIDRPAVGFNPCPVLKSNMLLESGFAYGKMIDSGNELSTPQPEMRIGIGHNTEINIFPPNYFHAFSPKESGFGSASLGFRHAVYFDTKQLVTLQGYLTPPAGSQDYGNTHTNFLLNGIYNYTFYHDMNVSFLFGFASNSSPPITPTSSFYSFNPIIDMNIPLKEGLNSYVEVFSQSKTAIDEGWGVILDGGFIFLLSKNITLDISGEQRLYGRLNEIQRSANLGFVFNIAV